MADDHSTLATFYTGWEAYQGHLIKSISPLSAEQLALRAGPDLRSIGDLITHMIGARARWFHQAIGEGGDETAAMAGWDHDDSAPRSAADLVSGLEATWRMIQSSLSHWTPEELAQPFERERNGEVHTLTRQWIIWHLLEHDLHHGGEISFSLGMHGLQAPDI